MFLFACSNKPYAIAYSSKTSDVREIFLTDIENKSTIKITKHASDGYPSSSPDGKHIAFYAKYNGRKTWSIHSMNVDGTNWTRLTHAQNKWDSAPTWSPDGKQIAFAREYRDSRETWQEEIWIMNADGSQQAQLKSINGGGPSFTPDGKILYHSKSKSSEICIANRDGSNLIKLTNNNAEDWFPKISPNGKQITFMSNRDGNLEIYVMNRDGSNQKRLTYNDVNDWNPTWSPDGSKLIFASENNTGYFHIYMMNTDGTSVRKIIENGAQPAWLK